MSTISFEEDVPKPLTMELETAKGIITEAVNKAQKECGIPNFIMEGIIAEIHSQISSKAKVELMADFNAYLEEMKKKEKEGGKDGEN